MTTEQKAKAYDEVVARINKAVNEGLVSENFGRDMLGIAESEDENIRKAIKCYVEDMPDTYGFAHGIGKKEMLAYLEKKKENPKNADSISTDCVSSAKCENEHNNPGDFVFELRQIISRHRYADMYSECVDDEEGMAREILSLCEKQKEQKPLSTEEIRKIRSEEYTKGFNDAAFGGKLKEWSEEDERMQKAVYVFIKESDKGHVNFDGRAITKEDCLAYLEKQKEPLTTEEKMKHPLYVEGFEDGKQVGAQYEAAFGKQKEQKPLSTEETELNSIAFLEQLGYTCISPKEQKKSFSHLEITNVVRQALQECQEYTNINPTYYAARVGATVERLIKEQKPAEYERPLLSKFEQAVYDCAWGKVTCKPEGETQEEYAKRWAEQFLFMVREWADDYIDFQIESIKCKAYDRGKADAEKPAEWSEEDKKMLCSVIKVLEVMPSARFIPIKREIIIPWLKSLTERFNLQPKQEWSEEDIDKMVNARARKSGTTKSEMEFYRQGIKDTLKSLRPQPKVEWREEDEKKLERIIKFIICFGSNDLTERYRDIDWLKKLPFRFTLYPHWTPSEEQMRALKYVAYHLMPDENYRDEMFSLYEDLKKL